MEYESEPLREVVLGLFAPGLVEANPSNSKPPVIEIDTASNFVTDKATVDRDELIEWARKIAVNLKFAIVIAESDTGGDKRKAYFRLECERGGHYASTSKKLKSESTGTRKCGCPFRLRGYFLADEKWHLTVVSGIHNHELDKEVEGHLIVGRLKPEEKKCMDEMTRNLIAPRNIISTLKERDPDNKTSSKQLYNACHRLRLKMRASMTEMQHLFKRLDENKYFFKSRSIVQDGTEHLQDIFFAHPKSVCLLNSFHTVLLMDSTYKTNKYKMPLFEIVGFTSTGKTFNVGFAWLANEKEDNFTWALQQCVSLLKSEDIRPKVIVTDRDTTLMNVVAEVFPTSEALVCRFHIEKNLSSKMKEIVKVKNGEGVKQVDVWNGIMNAFNDVLDSSTEIEYESAVLEFRKICERWPKFVHYVQQTVLDTDKEKVVSAWIDKHMHMGNRTTNRAETSHGVLKKWLTDGNGDLVKGWEAIHKMLINQFTEVQTQFGQSMSVAEHRYEDNPLYSFLFYKISRKAMDHIYTEPKRVKECGMDSKKCGCVMRRTFRLPCACVIAKMKNKLPIRLDEINKHWKKLSFDDEQNVDDEADDYSCLAEWKAIQDRLKTSDVTVKNDIRNQRRLIAYPKTTNIKAPVQNAKTKGAKKKKVVRGSTNRDKSRWEHVDAQFPDTQASQSKSSRSKRSVSQANPPVSTEVVIGNLTPTTISQTTSTEIPFVEHMPKFMHPFIDDIIDVEGDGYCGYRAVCLYNKGSQEDFELLRLSMKRELSLHKDLYVKLFGDEDRFTYVTDALYPPPRRTRHAVAPMDKWFSYPDMGFVVATILERVVVLLSKKDRSGGSKTCFPLRGIPPSDQSDLSAKILCLGALPAHFVLVKLKQGSPIPPTAHGWRQHCSTEGTAWESLFLDRQQKFDELLNIERGDISVGSTVGSTKENPIEF